ncbi:hypothetical protein VTK73DRAFT_6468 [Phialemonium thermophilum]|uniref:Uncharacterized protein n=1 Tax=Phialemonium thermophilum TaxID=223376 RepID=A0ABR3UZD6_9PEZI
MSQNHREGVNPLRPYYIPPSIGDEPIAPSSSSSAAALGSHALGSASRRHAATGGTYASKARDMFSDIDYKDYLSDSSPSALRTLKELLDELLWKYTSVLMAQPFEVAKTLLQVRSQDDVAAGQRRPCTTT